MIDGFNQGDGNGNKEVNGFKIYSGNRKGENDDKLHVGNAREGSKYQE